MTPEPQDAAPRWKAEQHGTHYLLTEDDWPVGKMIQLKGIGVDEMTMQLVVSLIVERLNERLREKA